MSRKIQRSRECLLIHYQRKRYHTDKGLGCPNTLVNKSTLNIKSHRSGDRFIGPLRQIHIFNIRTLGEKSSGVYCSQELLPRITQQSRKKGLPLSTHITSNRGGDLYFFASLWEGFEKNVLYL